MVRFSISWRVCHCFMDRVVNMWGEGANKPVSLGTMLVERYVVIDVLATNTYFNLLRAHDAGTAELGHGASRSVLLVLFDPSQLSVNRMVVKKVFEQMPCQHTQLMPVLDVICDNEYQGIVLAENKGLLLSQWQKKRGLDKRVPYSSIINIVRQVVRALQALHAEQRVHGCLTTDHILVDASDAVQIWGAGFHSGATLNRLPHVFQGRLTPRVYNGHTPSFQDDQFSLGTIVYELLTGNLPFDYSEGHSAQQVEKQKPKKPRQISVWQWYLLKRLMSQKSHQRWSGSLSRWVKLFASARYWTVYLFMLLMIMVVLAFGVNMSVRDYRQLVTQALSYQQEQSIEQHIHRISALALPAQLRELQVLKEQEYPYYSEIVQNLYVSLIKPTAITGDAVTRQEALPDYRALHQALDPLHTLFP